MRLSFVVILVFCVSCASSRPEVRKFSIEKSNSEFVFCSDCMKPTQKTLEGTETDKPINFESVIGNAPITDIVESVMSAIEKKSPDVVLYFDFNSIGPISKDSIDQTFLANASHAKKIILSSFTDDVGTLEQNKVIAQGRLNSAKALLMAAGIDYQNIETISNPLCCYLNECKDSDERAKNRRVEIFIEGGSR